MKTELFQLSLVVLFLFAVCMVFLVLFHLLSSGELPGDFPSRSSRLQARKGERAVYGEAKKMKGMAGSKSRTLRAFESMLGTKKGRPPKRSLPTFKERVI